MSTDIGGILQRSPIERKGPLPLHEQIRSSLELAIIFGEIGDGAPLPSVRRLARELRVAPTTVVRVYRDLLDAQLVRSVPKRGYFVTIGPAPDTEGPATREVRRLVDDAIDGALSRGVSLQALLQLVVEQIRARQQAARRVAVVGEQDLALDERVACVAQALEGLGVDVVGLPFEHLESRNGVEPRVDPADVTWFLVSVDEIRRATALLGPHARRIVPMTRTVRPAVREFIAAQPESTRFGIIAGSDDLIGRVLSMLRRLHPLRVPPLTTSVEHPREVARVLRQADALLIGVMATPHLGQRLPRGKPYVELTSMPDERTLRRLRALVASAAE